jgi:CheY-like chemotaxis protein
MRIVVFDDDFRIQELYKAILEEGNYDSAIYSCSLDAVTYAAENDDPSLFIVVPVTGEERGWDVIRALRNNPATADVPILAGRVLQEAPCPEAMDGDRLAWRPAAMNVDTTLACIEQGLRKYPR